MALGYLAIVLHAHLPFIRHPEQTEFLEERWLFETITECYIPLLEVIEKLYHDEIDFRLTLSLSPPLVAMLADSLLMGRYVKHLDSLIRFGESEVGRTAGSPDFQPLALLYLKRLLQARQIFEQKYHGNILQGFNYIQSTGKVELITSAATHGYFPLMRTNEAKRAQISVAVDSFTRHFGFSPQEFWLPECGYVAGVEDLLAERGLLYFFVDTHGLIYASPSPRYGVYAPVSCRNKAAVFGRDPESSRQVWDRHTGYPGDYFYREFYRDVAYDLELDYLKPYLPGGKIRVDTGFKYYRITGKGSWKEPYILELARQKAAEHADNFIFNRQQQVYYHAQRMDRKPLVVSPYDAELFGHWWYEGPQWLDFLCRRIHEQDVIKMVTPTEYLVEYPQLQTVELTMSSWGEGGYNLVWLNPANDWVYRHLHRAEVKICDLADLHADARGLEKRALNQAARELLLAQSSDWSFIMRTGTVARYAEERLKNHLGRFNLLANQVDNSQVDGEILSQLEQSVNIFPDLDYHIYSRHLQAGPKQVLNGRDKTLSLLVSSRIKVLILSWEYPPVTVGGLARHVYDLARALAEYGDEVHIITCPAAGKGAYYFENGVHVHRVPPEHVNAEDFMTWVRQLNQAMIEMSSHINAFHGPFDLIHAHDWLVEEAGRKLAELLKIPLLATIHATEYGRNHGLYSELQHYIHDLERQLTNEAKLVIACSRYMAHEVTSLFGLPPAKVRVVPNGVNPASLGEGGQVYRKDRNQQGRSPTILFFGRLVPEKGVQILLESVPRLVKRVSGVHLLVAGRGPYEEHLRSLSERLGVNDRVSFIGFVNDEELSGILEQSRVAAFPSIYEPFGIVVLEAMAAGVPVVVSDTGGLQDIVEHGVDGYKTPPGRADMLAYYLAELLVNPVLATDFCHQAWRKVQTVYNWHYIAAATRRVYQEAAIV
jgi:1,4-alpha-glucan branching enzyme